MEKENKISNVKTLYKKLGFCEKEILENKDISEQCKRWVGQWLKYCEEKRIKPWLFDFKTFYLKEENLKNESDPFLVWLQYKYDILNKVQPNEIVKKINDGVPNLGKEQDPDKLVFPIYNVLNWQNDQKANIRGDSMNSFQTTKTQLFKINNDAFGKEKEKCWCKIKEIQTLKEIPKIKDFFSKIANDECKDYNISVVYDNFKNLIDFFDEIKLFSSLTHSIGNFIVLPSCMNTRRGLSSNIKDYWDLTLKDIQDSFMSLKNGNELWKEYVETFYLQPYVYKRKDTYEVAELWDKHFNGTVLPREKENFKQFYENVNLLIKERGRYMTKIICEKIGYDDAPLEWNLNNVSLRYFDEICKK